MWHYAGRGPYTRALALLSHRATVSREPFFEGEILGCRGLIGRNGSHNRPSNNPRGASRYGAFGRPTGGLCLYFPVYVCVTPLNGPFYTAFRGRQSHDSLTIARPPRPSTSTPPRLRCAPAHTRSFGIRCGSNIPVTFSATHEPADPPEDDGEAVDAGVELA